MNHDENLQVLSEEVYRNKYQSPIDEFVAVREERFRNTDMREFIIYNFIQYPGSYLRELLLATFRFWKNLSYADWRNIFARLKGNSLVEYYMTLFALQYLGIDPEYPFELNYVSINVQDGKKREGVTFIGDYEGALRESTEEQLEYHYGVCIQDFVELRKRLREEGNS